MTRSPEISVIVPVYNVQDHVAACIASLRAQTWTDFEAIVVDDGSTDESHARLTRAIDGDARFQVIRQDNQGLSGARNTGLAQVSGRFVAFLDSDDRYAPAFLWRLHDALRTSGADWVACAVQFTYPDGGSGVHSAIHASPSILGLPRQRLWSFDDWRHVIRHFPSAWNKLYRRDLIEGLTYDVGTLFEDHGFYYRAALRTSHLLHVSEPLYLHARERPGQITSQDTDRVFEQIGVLETVAPLILSDAKRGGRAALSRLASRLLYERSVVIRDPDRRQAFGQAASAFMAQQGLDWQDRWDADVSPAWGLEMQGIIPLSVVVYAPTPDAPLAETLQALAAQHLQSFETILVSHSKTDSQKALSMAKAAGLVAVTPRITTRLIRRSAAEARAHGLAQAGGVYVTFLNAGDSLHPAALQNWVAQMERQQASFGVSAARHQPGDHVFSGFGAGKLSIFDIPRNTAWAMPPYWRARLDDTPAGKIFRTAMLWDHAIAPAGTANQEHHMIRSAAKAAEHSIWFPKKWVTHRPLPETYTR